MDQNKQDSSPSSSRPLIWDVARESGVSIGTVSRVLNGRSGVAEATREKVLSVIKKMNYSSAGRPPVHDTDVHYIGYVVPQMGYFVPVLEGVNEALEEYHASLVVCRTQEQAAIEASIMERFQHTGVRGALLVLPSQSPTELLALFQSGYPFVVIDPRYPLSDDIPTVSVSNMSGARAATEHLVRLGHRRIGVISGPLDWCASIDRLAGYRSVLSGAGLPLEPDLIVASNFTLEGGIAAAETLLTLPQRPTAIFAFNDAMALGVLHIAEKLGIKVPEELSVVGFNDSGLATYCTPPLTSVFQPEMELGRTAVKILYRLLSGQYSEAPRLELSTRLVVRASTVPPRPV